MKSRKDEQAESADDFEVQPLMIGEDSQGAEANAKPKHCEGTLGELSQDLSLVWNLLLISLLWMVSSFTFFMPKLMMKYIPGSIYFNTLLMNIADSLSTILSY